MRPNYWLVDALIERLALVVPEGVRVSASPSGDDVAIAAGGRVYTPVVRAIAERGDDDGPTAAVVCVLTELQTAIEDELETAWPSRSAMPEAETRGRFIQASFRDDGSEVLSLEPISVPDRTIS